MASGLSSRLRRLRRCPRHAAVAHSGSLPSTRTLVAHHAGPPTCASVSPGRYGEKEAVGTARPHGWAELRAGLAARLAPREQTRGKSSPRSFRARSVQVNGEDQPPTRLFRKAAASLSPTDSRHRDKPSRASSWAAPGRRQSRHRSPLPRTQVSVKKAPQPRREDMRRARAPENVPDLPRATAQPVPILTRAPQASLTKPVLRISV